MNQKNKLITIFFILILGVQVFSLMPNNPQILDITKENFHDIPRLLGTTSPLEVQEQQISTTKISPSLSVQEQETWQIGQSMNVLIDYPQVNALPESYSKVIDMTDLSDWFWTGQAYGDDIVAEGHSGTTYTGAGGDAFVYVYFQIDAISVGTFTYSYQVQKYNSTNSFHQGEETAKTIAITDDLIDRNGRATFRFYNLFNIVDLDFGIQYFDVSANQWATSYTKDFTDDDTFGDVTRCKAYLFNSYFDPDNDTLHLRSNYRITGTNIVQHELITQSPAWGTTFLVYSDEDWDLEVLEQCDYEWDSTNNYWEISNTIGFIDYHLIFTEITQKQYLAISDETSTYMENVGFEGSWNNDWNWRSGYVFDSTELNSTIVYDGSFSLRLEDTDAQDDKLDNSNPLPDGYYYFSFSYYVESFSGTSLYFAMLGGSWSYEIIDSTTNRWITIFFYSRIEYNSDLNFQFGFDDGQGVVFLDNFKIWQVNHEVETSSWRKIKVSGQMISWDGYSNPSVPNEDIELELRDRTADSSIVSDSTKTTDSSGNFEWEIDTSSHSELQDQREIEVRSYSLDSWFSTVWTDDSRTGTTTNWTPNANNTLSVETSNTKNGDALKVTKNQDIPEYLNPIYGESGTWDLTEIDYIRFWIYRSTGTAVTDFTFRAYNVDWETGYVTTLTSDIPTDATWYHLTLNFPSDFSDIGTNPDITTIDDFYFRLNVEVDTNDYAIYDSFQFITAQKSYFTPVKASDFPFYYETTPQDNEWDFSEDSKESVTDLSGSTLSTSDGYLNCITYSTWDGWELDNMGIDYTVHNTLTMRLRANTTDVYYWITTRDNGDSMVQTLLGVNATTTDWVVHEFTITGSYEKIWVQVQQPVIAEIDCDIIRPTFRDTPSISTADSYAWVSSQNNSFTYRTEIDSTLQGYYSDLTYFSTDQTVGSHTINATVYDDINRDGIVFIPGSSVTSSYSVTVSFSVSIEDYSLSDSYVHIYLTATKDGNYYIYEDDVQQGTNTFNKDGQYISHSRNTTSGITIDLAYKFVNSTDIVWFNTSYSNSKSAFYLTSYKPKVSSTMSVEWSCSIAGATITVIEDGVTKVDASGSSPATWSKSTTAGIHLVSCRWDLSGYVSLTHTFDYEVESAVSFSVTVNSFYLTDYNVYTYISATKSGDYYIYENETSVATGSFYDYGTTIQHARNSTSNIVLELCYQFINDTDEIWFNTTYSNPLSMLAATFIEDESNQYFEYGVDTLTLNWTIDQTALMILWFNGSYLTHASGTTYLEKILTPYFQTIGVYNFTVETINQFDRRSSSTMFLTVRDTISPTLIVEYANGTTFEDARLNTTLQFAAGESVDVEIYRNTTLVYSDTGVTTFNATIGTCGEWNITVVITDINSNSNNSYLNYTIQDTTVPEFLTYETTMKTQVGSTITQKWSINELNPDNYTITLAGVVVDTGVYTSSVSYSHTFTAAGIYTLTLTADDDYGNTAVANTIITVELPSEGQGKLPVYPTTEPEERMASGFEVILGVISLIAVIIVITKKRR